VQGDARRVDGNGLGVGEPECGAEYLSKEGSKNVTCAYSSYRGRAGCMSST
jgi:hypothetical protein